MVDSIRHLGDFLRSEMRIRHMSAHGFADFIGVSHTTINKFVDFGSEDVGLPTVDFLIKLAKATDKDIRYIITLVVPEEVLSSAEPVPEYMHLSQQIAALPPHYRKIIEVIIAAGLSE